MTDRTARAPSTQGHPKTPRRRWRIRPWRLLLVVTVIATLGLVGVGTGFVFGAIRDLPSVEEVDRLFTAETSVIFDRHGQPITEIHGPENRVSVDFEDIPEHVRHAFIAIEDERFYRHFGVDLLGIARAAINNLLGNDIQGASTITQQLARNLFPVRIGFERTLERKVQEAIMAIQLERRYTKDEILEMYLNQIFLGHNVYGIEAASRFYFGKSVKDLTIAEAALLAGIVKGPNLYSPRVNPEAAVQRRNLVINAMWRQGYITAEQAEEARSEPLRLAERRREQGYPYPYFVDYVIQKLLDYFTTAYQHAGEDAETARQLAARDVYAGGLEIYTTLDPKIQQLAEQAVAEVMDADFPLEGDNPKQAAT
ncbi:MAG TPA: transglycosylase domain-containing protein, partial [Bacillota bacterium]